MYKKIIESYIKNLNKNDIEVFCEKENIIISNKEIDIIFYYIKNRWQDLYYNKDLLFEELKKVLSESTYFIIINYYKKYKNYLM